jgi:transposase InsO family protein
VGLAGQGLDAGAVSIALRMARAGEAAPSVATIHRVLRRRGLVVDQPAKRPRSAWRRFEFAAPNGCWQIDGTGWQLADGSWAKILRVIDDHSRLVVASTVADAETTVAAWTAVLTGIARHGLPAAVLSDNGSAFTATPRGGAAAFERNLAALGIRHLTSRPLHPQTCGKTERSHGTLKRWLARQPPAATLAELQAHVDAFDALYNTTRPHQALAGATPAERYAATPPAIPTPRPSTDRVRVRAGKASANGVVTLGQHGILLGRRWAGATVTVITSGAHAAVFHDNQLIRQLDIDPTRRYQTVGVVSAIS